MADMLNTPLLVPAPRRLTLAGGALELHRSGLIVLDWAAPQALRLAAGQLQAALREHAGVEWEIVAATAVPPDEVRAVLSVVPGGVAHDQGYVLTVGPARIDVIARQPAGIFYAVQTLRQLLDQAGSVLPRLRCHDWPDYPHRGVLLDVSRDRVPTMETLLGLVDLLASWKVNQLQLYTEHTFAYRSHPQVWAEASPLTGEDILRLDAFCRERFIELVPNQNTFGHMHRWLIHERYRPLAEAPDGSDTPWGFRFQGPYSISPAVPQSLDLVRSLLDELLPHFHSRQVNVGCDETFDLGQGLSKAKVEQLGVGRVYLDFLLSIYREVKARGHTMQFWGDIITAHPELVPELPPDAIALEWGYEADHPFQEHGALFAASGVPFYVCAGTSSWRTLAGRTDNALGNLRNAAVHGLANGAVGYLTTDWGDEGHWQPLPVSFLGFLVGAALSWGYEANQGMDVVAALDAFAFQDEAGLMGRLAYDLGNVYQEVGLLTANSSALFNVLQATPEGIREYLQQAEDPGDLVANLKTVRERIDQIVAPLSQARMRRTDAELVKSEFTWVADMLRHACGRALWALGDHARQEELARDADRLIDEYARLWHARSRPGGFQDSVARMARMRDAYRR